MKTQTHGSDGGVTISSWLYWWSEHQKTTFNKQTMLSNSQKWIGVCFKFTNYPMAKHLTWVLQKSRVLRLNTAGNNVFYAHKLRLLFFYNFSYVQGWVMYSFMSFGLKYILKMTTFKNCWFKIRWKKCSM